MSPSEQFFKGIPSNLFVKLLALALTNLVLDMANLVTNLAKPSHSSPSHQADQT